MWIATWCRSSGGLAWHYKAYGREQPVIDRMAYAELISKPRLLSAVYGPMRDLSCLGSSGASDEPLGFLVEHGLYFIM